MDWIPRVRFSRPAAASAEDVPRTETQLGAQPARPNHSSGAGALCAASVATTGYCAPYCRIDDSAAAAGNLRVPSPAEEPVR